MKPTYSIPRMPRETDLTYASSLILEYVFFMNDLQRLSEEYKSWAREFCLEGILIAQFEKRYPKDRYSQAHADLQIKNLWRLHKNSFEE